jgi:hypothetical protein
MQQSSTIDQQTWLYWVAMPWTQGSTQLQQKRLTQVPSRAPACCTVAAEHTTCWFQAGVETKNRTVIAMVRAKL